MGNRRIEDLLDNDNYVAHYTNRNSFKKILETNQIRLGKIKQVNDLSESLMDWFEGDPATGGDETSRIVKLCYQEARLITLLKNRIRVFCATQYKQLSSSDRFIENKYYGIPSLWAHYGGNHKGTCLILDKRKITAEIIKHFEGFNIHKEIYYQEPLGIDNYGNAYNRDNYSTYLRNLSLLWNEISKDHYLNDKFFSKSECWHNENEYRWMIFSITSQHSFFNITSSLSAIILGGKLNLNNKNDQKYINWIFQKRDDQCQSYPIYQIYCEQNKYQLLELEKLRI